MNIGRLRQRVIIQKPVETVTDSGDVSRTWQSIGQRWAEVRPISGREFWEAAQVHSDVTHRVIMRRDEQLDRTHRLLFGQAEDGRRLEITELRNIDERNFRVELLCKEVTT